MNGAKGGVGVSRSASLVASRWAPAGASEPVLIRVNMQSSTPARIMQYAFHAPLESSLRRERRVSSQCLCTAGGAHRHSWESRAISRSPRRSAITRPFPPLPSPPPPETPLLSDAAPPPPLLPASRAAAFDTLSPNTPVSVPPPPPLHSSPSTPSLTPPPLPRDPEAC